MLRWRSPLRPDHWTVCRDAAREEVNNGHSTARNDARVSPDSLANGLLAAREGSPPAPPETGRREQGELVILHVLSTPAAYVYPDTAWLPWDKIEQANRAAGERGLHRLEAQIKISHPDLRVHSVLAIGVAVNEIVQPRAA